MTQVAEVLHMNGGNDDSSYANNSHLQKTVIEKAAPVLKHTVKSVIDRNDFHDDHSFKVADLGCSSNMNALLVASNIIDAANKACLENNHITPQFQVFLNDLTGNDFNTLFKLLPEFYKLVKNKGEKFGPCFVSAVPGSFYYRLFPDKGLHVVHSSYSVHWLSQVPRDIENNNLNIFITKTSPPNVFQAYKKQFRTDFMKFLQLRNEEMVHGGSMVLTLCSRSNINPSNDDFYNLWELLNISLLDMVEEGLVQETDVNSFNFPIYFSHEDELMDIIDAYGLLSLDNLNTFEVCWDPDHANYIANGSEFTDQEANYNHGKYIAKQMRAVTEPLLKSHFGNSIMDVLFKKFGKKVAEDIGIRKTTMVCSVVVSLTKI